MSEGDSKNQQGKLALVHKNESDPLLLNPGKRIQTVKFDGQDRIQFRRNGIQLVSPATAQDDVDTTTRITIPSYQGSSGSQFGEGIRLMVNDENAKNMIAWYDQFTEPDKPKLRAWIGYHYGTYLGTVHDHISIETPDARGALNTRFGISTALTDLADVDFNMADVQHTASQGGKVRLAVSPAMQGVHPRELLFSTGTDHAKSRRRWGIQADNTKEAGNNSGSHFRLVRYTDGGEVAGAVMSVHRNNGRIGFNTEPYPGAQVTIVSKTQALRLSAMEGSESSGVLGIVVKSAMHSSIDVRTSTEGTSRFNVSGEGTLRWGDGMGPADVSIRRVIVDGRPALQMTERLKINGDGGSIMLTSPNGITYKISVSDKGKIITSKVED